MTQEKPKPPSDEDQQRTDEVLRRLLKTPPQPFTPKKKAKQTARPAKK